MILLLVIIPILFIDLFNFNMSNEDDNDDHHQLLCTHALRRPVGYPATLRACILVI